MPAGTGRKWFSTKSDPNTHLNSGWVSHVSGEGWGIMPLWVGPQSPCNTDYPKASYPDKYNWLPDVIPTGKTAADLGASEADLAADRATSLGMGSSIIYYDIENYSESGSCGSDVGKFLSGWVSELHLKGFQAGVYISPGNYADMTTPPDAIWVSYRDGNSSASDLGIATSTNWSGKRIHQYCFGSKPCAATTITDVDTQENISIDLDAEDGPVFSTTVTAATTPPDLITQGLSVSPISGQAGSSVTVSFTIKNQGGSTAAASTTNVRLAASSSTVTTSDPLLISLNTQSIAAGGRRP